MSESTSLIAAGTTVKGHISGREDLVLQGSLQGSLRLEGTVTIDSGGRADATIEVTRAIIHGIVVGSIVAADIIELSETARVRGDLTAPRVVVQDGATFSGLIDMGEIAVAKAPPSSRERPAVPASRPAPVAAPAPAPAPAPRFAPSPPPASRPIAAPVQMPVPVPEMAAADDDDEPELPDGAAKKQIAIKKKK